MPLTIRNLGLDPFYPLFCISSRRKVAERSICNSPAADSSFGSASQGRERRRVSAWRGFSNPILRARLTRPPVPAAACFPAEAEIHANPLKSGRASTVARGIVMQPDRGGRPRRGSGRPNRRRPGGREKPAESSSEDSHSRGGGGRGRRGVRGRAAASAPSAPRGCESVRGIRTALFLPMTGPRWSPAIPMSLGKEGTRQRGKRLRSGKAHFLLLQLPRALGCIFINVPPEKEGGPDAVAYLELR